MVNAVQNRVRGEYYRILLRNKYSSHISYEQTLDRQFKMVNTPIDSMISNEKIN